MTDRVIRDGMVAVLISPNFGAGWSTWARSEHAAWCRHDPQIVEAVEAGDLIKVVELAEARDEGIYCGGVHDLIIAWVPEGAPYYIHEYDGSERIITNFLTA